MTRTLRGLAGSLLMSVLVALFSASALAEEDSGSQENVRWQVDPVCRMIFFAVLEGLYEDGVQDEVVDLVIGAKDGVEEGSVRRCFVFQCELCHAVFEAFVLYRGRQPFQNSKGKTTFGPGVDPGVVADLASDEPRARVFAMGRLIRPWIERRIEKSRLSKEELIELHDRIAKYAEEGKELLARYKADPNSTYLDWNFYGTCQACEATDEISRMIRDRKE